MVTVDSSSATQTSQQVAALPEQTSCVLKIIRDNFNTQYATQSPSLAAFRDAVSAHGAIKADATLLADFRSHVPLSNYEVYKPFVQKFDVHPCREEEVANLLSPGLPDYLELSGSTTGAVPKVMPKYKHNAGLDVMRCLPLNPNAKTVIAMVVSTAYRDIKEIERAPGEVVQKVIVGHISGGTIRRSFGWHADDEDQLTHTMPWLAAPRAATLITHFGSFLTIQGLFFLACRGVTCFFVPFSTVFLDLIRHIDENWDLLVSCIRDGTLPDLEGLDDVRKYLQAQFHANPERAAELLEVGPPFSVEGWVARVWPELKLISAVCSGPFAAVLPQVRSLLGPNITLHGGSFIATEAYIGFSHANKLDEFVLQANDAVEFLDVSQEETHENLLQPWEVEVGKEYELVVTTRDGLWRYRMGDVFFIVGFDEKNSPIFKFMGRRTLTIQLSLSKVPDSHLLKAIQALGADDTIRVQEFTATEDYRAKAATVGFFVELAGPLGPNAHQARQKLFDALAELNVEHQNALAQGRMCLPTIRIVKAGTFTEYRQLRAKTENVPPGQIKVPSVLSNPTLQEWILKNVVQEL